MGNSLSVWDLLSETYSKLCENNSEKEIFFGKKVLSEIADDSDWHRHRTGYMGYEKVNIIKIKGNKWVLGLGKKCGAYPGNQYVGDIIALDIKNEKEINKKSIEEIAKQIDKGEYFRNSLIVGTRDGGLEAFKKSKLSMKLLEIVESKGEDYIAREAKVDVTKIMVDTLSPVVRQGMEYKPEFVDFLRNSIEKVLTDNY